LITLRHAISIVAAAAAVTGALHLQFACAGAGRELAEPALAQPQRPEARPDRAKNVILFLGDGMESAP
jgi:alkaline phosphatase